MNLQALENLSAREIRTVGLPTSIWLDAIYEFKSGIAACDDLVTYIKKRLDKETRNPQKDVLGFLQTQTWTSFDCYADVKLKPNTE